MQRALEGIRILDLTSVVMGPLATQMLGDFGADVIKVESPQGDTTRRVGPMHHPLMGWVYLNLNRNKRSLVLDLKQPAALDALKRLAQGADVLVFSVRPAAMARLGISYEALARSNPRLIGVSLVGFGDGPYAGKPVYEDLIQGLTSIPNLLVRAGSQTPHYVPFSFNDRMVGTHAAMSIMVALFHRERAGQGQQIQVPMFETMAQHVLAEHGAGRSFVPPLGAPGYLRTLNKERRPYATRDGHVCVIIYTDKHWRDFFQLTGETQRYANDPRMKDIGTRTEHSDALYAIVADHMGRRSTAEWLAALEGIDVPCAPLHTLESLFEDQHLNQTGFLRTVEHPSEGRLLEAGPPGTWSLSPPDVRRRAPRLGEHSAQVLREAGLDEDEIRQLAASGATHLAGGP